MSIHVSDVTDASLDPRNGCEIACDIAIEAAQRALAAAGLEPRRILVSVMAEGGSAAFGHQPEDLEDVAAHCLALLEVLRQTPGWRVRT